MICGQNQGATPHFLSVTSSRPVITRFPWAKSPKWQSAFEANCSAQACSLHPKFLALSSDFDSCLWHCPKLAVFLRSFILFGPWLSSLIFGQIIPLPGISTVSHPGPCWNSQHPPPLGILFCFVFFTWLALALSTILSALSPLLPPRFEA